MNYVSDSSEFKKKKELLFRRFEGKVLKEKYLQELSKIFTLEIVDSMLLKLD